MSIFTVDDSVNNIDHHGVTTKGNDMQVMDNKLKCEVDVYDSNCMKKECYWPRSNLEVFNQGRGYSGATKYMLCGTRHAHGCPINTDDAPHNQGITP